MEIKLERHELGTLWVEDMKPTPFHGFTREMWSGPHDDNGFEIHWVLKNDDVALCFRLNTGWGTRYPQKPTSAMRFHWSERPEGIGIETRERDECPLLDGRPCWLERVPDTQAWAAYSTLVNMGVDALYEYMLQIINE